jgi:uncharacterized membrane protein
MARRHDRSERRRGILGGLGVCFRSTRRAAGWWWIALLIAVFPANIHAISTGMNIGGHALPAWLLWARLPFQLLFNRLGLPRLLAPERSLNSVNLFRVRLSEPS